MDLGGMGHLSLVSVPLSYGPAPTGSGSTSSLAFYVVFYTHVSIPPLPLITQLYSH